MSCQYSVAALVVLALFILFVHFGAKHVNRKFVSQLLSEFDDDGQHSLTFVLSLPNDETLFFTPTLEILRNSPMVSSQDVTIRALVLTRGGSSGPGDKHVLEMEELCFKYNMQCSVLDVPEILDESRYEDPEKAIPHIEAYLERHKSDFVITFDRHGGDHSHIHVNTHNAVAALKKKKPDLKVWTLITFNGVERFLPIYVVMRYLFRKPSCVYNTPVEVYRNWKIHGSQRKWYTPLYAFFSSYSYANSFHIL
ncbi:putative N-acetylglucosaminyl-phosphatidylinositol de-N-acetylase [Babesia sp. Xinjiang]|uniref:putative N-acetylglucosaminyl-phosphatidylinositol de-N-acetylase n=1 Tax=Babesia sp. Xinjiang TaxID=462227 RepID=UPI000A23E047|nr:putative N-acetylglucosaminyl-phosphatidylinositol de-N-acetylase [Babesia sp. Xinjiang]ORM40050.1 putative N-acetylglucosaminyl-phosphatidylinositol de-N-acetylase [Babesia sp. Xinjiang]